MTPSSSTQMHLSGEGAPFNPALLAEARLGSMQEFKDALGWTPSGRVGHVWVDIRNNVHNVRDLRSILLTLAYVAQAAPTCEVLCILQLSRITQNRLDAELLNLRGLLGPGGDRVHVVLGFPGTPLTLPALLEQANIGPALVELIAEKRLSPNAPSSQRAVAGLLFTLMLMNATWSLSAAEIGEYASASHPTVSAVLKQFLRYEAIHRSGNKFFMAHFPRFAWTRWLKAEVALRKSVYFVSRTGEPREPAAMCKRLGGILDDAHVAVGGILGAKHWFPGLDISGSGRFELVINANPSIDLSFLKKLDPALERVVEEPLNPALVVHFLTRHEPYFQDKDDGFLWADPVVCLTDLHAAGFDHQAEDLLLHLLTKREIA
jgi:hypothetical protein